MLGESVRRISTVLWLAVVGVASCTTSSVIRPAQLVFLTREGCVNTTVMRANLDDALRSLGLPSDYQVLDLATLPEADARRAYPTPTLLYANRDVFGMAEPRPPFPGPT